MDIFPGYGIIYTSLTAVNRCTVIQETLIPNDLQIDIGVTE